MVGCENEDKNEGRRGKKVYMKTERRTKEEGKKELCGGENPRKTKRN